MRVSSLKFGSSLDDAQELLQFSQPTVQANPKPQTPNPKPQTPNPKPQTPPDTLVQSLAGIVDSGTSCLVFPGHNVHGKKKKKNKQHSIHHTASPLNTTHYMLSNLKAAQRTAGYLKDNPFALFSSASR